MTIEEEELTKSIRLFDDKNYFVALNRMTNNQKGHYRALHDLIYNGGERKKAYDVRGLRYDAKIEHIAHLNINPETQESRLGNDITIYTKPLIEKAYELLRDCGITNLSDTKWKVEYHQRNCFGKEKQKMFQWHTDYAIISPFYNVYTVIFYIRKDKTVHGGNFKCMPPDSIWSNKKEEINIEEGDILMFDGSMVHRAQEAYGFGCRDAIVVFINKNKWF